MPSGLNINWVRHASRSCMHNDNHSLLYICIYTPEWRNSPQNCWGILDISMELPGRKPPDAWIILHRWPIPFVCIAQSTAACTAEILGVSNRIIGPYIVASCLPSLRNTVDDPRSAVRKSEQWMWKLWGLKSRVYYLITQENIGEYPGWIWLLRVYNKVKVDTYA